MRIRARAQRERALKVRQVIVADPMAGEPMVARINFDTGGHLD